MHALFLALSLAGGNVVEVDRQPSTRAFVAGAVGTVVGGAVGALSAAGGWYVGAFIAAPRCPPSRRISSSPPPPEGCDTVDLSTENLGTAVTIVVLVTQASAITGGIVGMAVADDDDAR